ncbi:hypothetical protein [Ralstonia solanacearum]|uniref:hypothetical protein n=1 Tax=Ralstonia solanacearum TaxID=305 RepID=UPI000E674059|nr:hypothetical protein [Ralstonia solanacearum]RIJ85357.1 hypothetical protein RSP822_16085 [Ralstonia solanacearum]
MQTNHHSRQPVQTLLCSVLFLIFAGITAIGILARKHAAGGIDCIPDPRATWLVKFGIGGAALFVGVCCLALLLAVCFARCGQEQQIG